MKTYKVMTIRRTETRIFKTIRANKGSEAVEKATVKFEKTVRKANGDFDIVTVIGVEELKQ